MDKFIHFFCQSLRHLPFLSPIFSCNTVNNFAFSVTHFFQLSTKCPPSHGHRHLPLIRPPILRSLQRLVAINKKASPDGRIAAYRRIHCSHRSGASNVLFSRRHTEPWRCHLPSGRFQQFRPSIDLSTDHWNHDLLEQRHDQPMDVLERYLYNGIRDHWLCFRIVCQCVEYIVQSSSLGEKLVFRKAAGAMFYVNVIF